MFAFDVSQYDFTDSDISEAVVGSRLLSMEIECNSACNYRCAYCYASNGTGFLPDLPVETVFSAIREAHALGTRKIVILGGEPLLYKPLSQVIEQINGLGMGCEIFTNASLLTSELAAMLATHNTRVVIKYNSLDADVQDRMCGVADAFAKANQAINLLRENGLTEPGRLVASTVICTENLDGLPALWRYLRQNGIKPYFEILTPQGRLLCHRNLLVSPERLESLFNELAAIDHEFGFHWEPQPPLVGGKCLRHTYSCLLNVKGEIMPCVGLDIPIGKWGERPLADILASSAIMQDLKNHRNTIKGPCRTCEKADSCYGCRGTAYQVTGDYLASDPYCWRNAGKCPDHNLFPVDTSDLVPHRPPMRMVECIETLGDESTIGMVIRPDNRFCDSNGVLSPAALPELAAQACAAADSFRHNGLVPQGMLTSCSNIQVLEQLKIGDRIHIHVKEASAFENFHVSVFRFTKDDGTLCATGELTLCSVD